MPPEAQKRPGATGAADGTATLNQLLQRAAGFPEAGLRFLDRRERESWYGWDSVHAGALAVAGGLAARGIEPGQRVALVFATGPEFMDAFFGTLYAGAVPVPLYPPVRLGRLDEYHRRTARMLRAVSARIVLVEGRVRRIFGETLALAQPPLGVAGLEDLRSGPETASDLPRSVREDDLAMVQFSSGTTVEPKPVALSHRAVLAQVRLLNQFWPDSEERIHSGVSWLPLYHDMGLIGCVFPALERPAVLTLIGPEVFVTRPAVWLRAISRYRATISPAPNFAYGLCVKKVRDEDLAGVDLSCWEVALNGAEAVAPEVLRAFQSRFEAFGFRATALTPVYGLSEAALAVTFSSLRDPFVSGHFDRQALARDGRAVEAADGQEIVSVGGPLPEFELEIRDETGLPLAQGEVGRIWVRGPSLMEGYLDQPAATAATLRGGWLDTGDLGFLREGRLFLTGRAKDMLLLRGRNYPPQEAEQAVDGVTGVRTGCVAAASLMPEGGAGEELVLFIEAHGEASDAELRAIPEAARKAVLAHTGLSPDHVVLLEPGTLPRTSSGKLRRSEAVRLFLEGELKPPKRVTALGMAVALGRSALAYARHRKDQKGAEDAKPDNA